MVEQGWDHHEAIVNGVRLHYVQAGEGPLVVLLHGFPEFWWSWHRQIPALVAAGYRVIAPDMRGYNTSEKPPGVASYHIDLLAADVAGLLRIFGGEHGGFLVGHDWGGVVAWHTAGLYPELVQKLIILNAPHPDRFVEVLRAVAAQRRKSWYIGLFQFPWLPERILPRSPALVKRFFLGSGANPHNFTDDDARQYAAALNQPGTKTAIVNYYRSLGRRMIKTRMRALSQILAMPTLVIWGKNDVALDRANADPERLRRWVPDLQVELVAASHWVQNDVPQRVNDLLTTFFDR